MGFPDESDEAGIVRLSRRQHGVITRAQALANGFTAGTIRSRTNSRRWRRIHRAVFVTFTGPVPRLSMLWAAVLAGGDPAILSHHSAAELWGLIDGPAPTIHLTIPADRRLSPISGVRIHRSPDLARIRHPSRQPPRTRIDDTVLDLASGARSVDEAIAVMTAAVGRRLTTTDHLAIVLDGRKRIRWRREFVNALSDIHLGVHSPLELRYLRDVERAHALPQGSRQSRASDASRHIYRDVRYDGYRTVVELDGQVAHPIEARAADALRDNVSAREGNVVLHYGWNSVTTAPCRVAAEVAAVLAINGWTAAPRLCGPACMIRES